jgi:hypothetical protein
LSALLSLHYSKPRLVARQNHIELRELGGEPVITGAMLALAGNLGNPHRILSEWRWACAFSFTRDSGCVRIFPEQFFETENFDLIKNTSDSIVLIMDETSLTPQRIELLKAAGFAQIADVGEKVFFARWRRS